MDKLGKIIFFIRTHASSITRTEWYAERLKYYIGENIMDTSINFPLHRCKQWPRQQMQTVAKSTDANSDQVNRCKQWPSQQMQTVTKSTDANSDQVNRCKQWPSQQAPCTNRISIHTVNIQTDLWSGIQCNILRQNQFVSPCLSWYTILYQTFSETEIMEEYDVSMTISFGMTLW